jgi:hypothetical protein
MFFNPRKLFYSNAIEFPSTKTAGALTLLSEEFELTNTDRTHIVLSALDASKITNTLTVYAKGSFDSGTTWMTLGTYTDLANGAGAISVKKIVPYAPLVKVEAVFSSSGALSSGHGIKIDVVMEEGEDGLNKDFFEDVITLPAGSIESAYFDTTLTLGAKETASFSITGLPTSNGSVSVDGNNVAVYNSDVAEVVTAIITGGATADGNIGIVLPSLAQVDIAVQGGDQQVETLTVTGAPTVSGNIGITLPDLATVNVAVIGNTYQVETLTVATSGSAAGTATITLPDETPVEVTIDVGDTTPALIGDRIRLAAASFTAIGWTVGGTNEVVTFTEDTAVEHGATTASVTWGDSGATGSFGTQTLGVVADTINEVATKIREASFTGWVVTGTDAEVIFTETAKLTHIATSSVDWGTTTATGSFGVPVAGVTPDTAADVATKLRGGAYDGWTAGGADTTVTFTKDVAGAVAGGAGMFTGDTGVTGSIASTTAGGDTDTLASIATKFAAVAYTDWDCTSNDVLVEFVGKVNGPLTDIVFNAGATGMTISEITKVDGIADPTTGTLVIAGENVVLEAADILSLSALLAKIAAHSYTNWTTAVTSPRITFTAKTLEDITDLTVDTGDTTGITFSAVTTTGGVALGDNETVYGDTLDVSGFRKISKVKVVATAVPANVNATTLYVQGSLDGLSWYDVLPTTTAIDAATVSFETTGYVGLHARVCLHTAETTGSLEAGHNIVASAVLDY